MRYDGPMETQETPSQHPTGPAAEPTTAAGAASPGTAGASSDAAGDPAQVAGSPAGALVPAAGVALAADDDATLAVDASAARPLVLVMHASVGSGHRSAAEAVAQAFGYPSQQRWRYKTQPRWASGFTDAELSRALRGAVECERTLTGSGSSRTAFVRWVSSVCS